MSTYFTHTMNQNDKSFIKILDFANAIIETQNQIKSLEYQIDTISWKISSLKLELINVTKELKPTIIEQIKTLAEQQKSIKLSINNKLKLTDGPDGYRAKISRLGCDIFFRKVEPDSKGFVDWVLTIGIINSELVVKFNEKIKLNVHYPYVSNYAQKISQGIIDNNHYTEFI